MKAERESEIKPERWSKIKSNHHCAIVRWALYFCIKHFGRRLLRIVFENKKMRKHTRTHAHTRTRARNTHARAHTHTRARTRTHTHTHRHTHTRTHTRTHTHTHTVGNMCVWSCCERESSFCLLRGCLLSRTLEWQTAIFSVCVCVCATVNTFSLSE